MTLLSQELLKLLFIIFRIKENPPGFPSGFARQDAKCPVKYLGKKSTRFIP
jgi:hypothetical protein|tara:strand:- start:1630 stop:1782 length:153 start_codon:yes stop_codon:yes gene_type:complete